MERAYQAIVLGQPQRAEGRVETNVGRDLQDRKKMAAFSYMSNRHAVAGPVCSSVACGCPINIEPCCSLRSGGGASRLHLSAVHEGSSSCGLLSRAVALSEPGREEQGK